MYLYVGFFVYLLLSIMVVLILIFSSFSLVYLVLELSSLKFFDYFSLCFYFDSYNLIYMYVLFSMVSSIHLFIGVYMSDEINLFRFFLVLNLFVMSMVVLLMSPNLISLMLGWDGLGFSSFVLVAWFGCFSSRFASLKTFLMKRLGDGLILVSLYYFFMQGHFFLLTIDYMVKVVFFVMLLSFFTKSAHFPFSSWLPDAMAAPTPVSALVHSSTLVTAGLYLLFRFSYILSSDMCFFIQLLGLMTLLMGSLGACFDKNSKKMVAYSTVSQLGFLSYVLSVGCFDLCFSYMMVHALFKAMLFMSVGCCLVLKSHKQDMRHLKNSWSLKPLVTFSFFFSCFSLSGFPFFSGFYMKELVIKSLSLFNFNYLLVLIFFLSLVFTAYYSFRLFVITSLSYLFKYGTVSQSDSLDFMVFFSLYISVFGLGVILYNSFKIWLNFGSSVMIVLYGVLGLFVSFMSFHVTMFEKFFSMMKYFIYMFYLNLVSVSLKKVYVLGSFYLKSLDMGFLLFSYMGQLSSPFSLKLKSLMSKSFVSNWLSLLGLSLFFIFLIFKV